MDKISNQVQETEVEDMDMRIPSVNPSSENALTTDKLFSTGSTSPFLSLAWGRRKFFKMDLKDVRLR